MAVRNANLIRPIWPLQPELAESWPVYCGVLYGWWNKHMAQRHKLKCGFISKRGHIKAVISTPFLNKAVSTTSSTF